jgi:hypothetical protein
MNRIPRLNRMGAALAILPIVVVVVLLLVWPRVTHFSADGISFDVPSGWTIHQGIGASSGPGQTLALIGTMPWGPCDAGDINCHFQERLSRQEIEVQIDLDALLGDDFCAYARDNPDLTRTDGIRVTRIHYFRIGGRPAISTEYSLDTSDYYGSDGWRKWDIAPAETTGSMFQIFAKWRGPGDDEFLAELDQLVASITFGPPRLSPATVPDCGDPFPSAPPT